MKITLSVIKADVGSKGGHTEPHQKMVAACERTMRNAIRNGLILDGRVTYTGDDIALIMSHTHGENAAAIHGFAWECFLKATAAAKKLGCYGAGQDLLVDAPSGNLRGAGPAVAEIEFELLPKHRPAEAFLVFAADKCGPGAYNFALWNTLCNPMKNGGLLLSPILAKGFMLTVIDMDHKSRDNDRIVKLKSPEEAWLLAALLRNIDRYAVEAVHSCAYPEEKLASISATRLHNIAGKYTGKDDPVMIFRTQGIFPAPEEVIAPYKACPYVTGDARGSHTMALMPMPVNSAVDGEYCQPIVSCIACSMNADGSFSNNSVDIFAGKAWDEARRKALHKSDLMREQGFFGVAMASQEEIAYTGLMETLKKLDERFEIRKNPA